MLDDYERNSYCLYRNKKGTETDTLQLIIGRSIVQIWHKIHSNDKTKKKEELPNKGEPFLEYIWTNRIPVNQEREKTRLRIEIFNCGLKDKSHDKLNDFYLEVYWFEENVKKEGKDKIEKGEINSSENMIRWTKVIKRKDIIKKFHAVRHACKALEHLNKRYKSKYLANNYIRVHKVG